MKKLILLSITTVFCFVAKAQTDSTQLAKNFLEAIKSGEIENLQNLFATPAVFRSVFKETKGFTDKQVEEITSKSPKLKADFDDLLTRAKEKKADLSKIQFQSLTILEMGNEVYSISITFSVKGKTGKVAVSAMSHSNNWYLVGILHTSKAF